VTIVGADTLRPTLGPLDTDGSRGIVDLRFGEPVVNLDQIVVSTQRPGALPGSGGATVAGTWACSDGRGSPIDCAAGAITARFTAAAPATLTEALWADLVPDGRTGVVDLAGNPLIGYPFVPGGSGAGPPAT